MKKKLASYLFFATGAVNIITSVLYFNTHKALWGLTYLFLAITFIALGMSRLKRQK